MYYLSSFKILVLLSVTFAVPSLAEDLENEQKLTVNSSIELVENGFGINTETPFLLNHTYQPIGGKDCSVHTSLLESVICEDDSARAKYTEFYQQKDYLQTYVYNNFGVEVLSDLNREYRSWRQDIDFSCSEYVEGAAQIGCVVSELQGLVDTIGYYNTFIGNEFFPLSSVFLWQQDLREDCNGGVGEIFLDETNGYEARKAANYPCKKKSLDIVFSYAEKGTRKEFSKVQARIDYSPITRVFEYDKNSGYYSSFIEVKNGDTICVAPYEEEFITKNVSLPYLFRDKSQFWDIEFYKPHAVIERFEEIEFTASNYQKYEFLVASLINENEKLFSTDLFPYSRILRNIDEYKDIDPLPFDTLPLRNCLDKIQDNRKS